MGVIETWIHHYQERGKAPHDTRKRPVAPGMDRRPVKGDNAGLPILLPGKSFMPIWVDADACPVPVRDILCRAADRWKIQTTFIANHVIRVTPGPFIRTRQVPRGFDVADNEIMDLLSAGDLVITQDIPLAAEAIEKGADVFNPRGQAFTPENIRQRLAVRNLMEELRSAGQITGGPSAFSQGDRKEFADQLDRWLQKNHKRSG